MAFSKTHMASNCAQSLLILFFVGLLPANAQTPSAIAGIRGGTFPDKWITGGPKCVEVPDWQVHEYNEDLFIIRESGCTDAEKPFLYLFFGKDRAMLQDTGAGPVETARVVTAVMSAWLKAHNRPSIPLVVAHSHSHGDHIAGDSQFAALPAVTIVPLTVPGTAQFFGVRNWPTDIGQIDLGDRIIDVISIPGHDVLSLALYDRQTGILFTGDSLYPGRIYIKDFEAFQASTQRLVDFTHDRIVTHILGSHIEQSTTPYVDYPIGTRYAPYEAPAALSRAHLLEMNDALKDMKASRDPKLLRDFTIWPIDAQHPFPHPHSVPNGKF